MRRGEARDIEALDHELAEAFLDRAPCPGPGRVLVVCGDSASSASLLSLLKKHNHHAAIATSLEDGRAALARTRHDLVILSDTLPDGSGIDFTESIARKNPSTKVILHCATDSSQLIIEAMRRGAVDVIHSSLEPNEIARRIELALAKSRAEQQREERVARLKNICQKLNAARHEVSQQLDTLCKDLVSAYQDSAEQVNEATMAAEFRTLLKQELDLEELLRTTLEYMLTKTGPTNAAVFLPSPSGKDFALGAYVNYDCPRESVSVLLDHLCSAICPQMCQETEMVSFDDAEEFAQWIGSDAGILADSQVIALSCRFGGECLAVMVLFRPRTEPFADDLAATLDVLRPIFAEQISQIIRVHHRLRPQQWPADSYDSDDEFDYESDFEDADVDADDLDCDDDLGLAA